MEDLPEEMVLEIFKRVGRRSDQNSFSLTCKRLHRIDNEQQKRIRLGFASDISNKRLSLLCRRFHNLEKVVIFYSRPVLNSAKKLDDRGFYNLSISCPKLTDLSINCGSAISDSGLRHVASCSNLSALNLMRASRVSGVGILSVLVGCQRLRSLSIAHCNNVASMEWLEYAGNLQTLQDLSIMNCRGIREGDLVKLGNGWRNLRLLHFEPDAENPYDPLAVDPWQEKLILCDSMRTICLVKCTISPGRVLACMLGKCKSLEKISLNMCVGVRDSDVIQMISVSRNLRAISLQVPPDLQTTNPIMLSDECLKAVALNCPNLESFRLSLSPGKLPSSFTQEGILALAQKCPLRELALENCDPFNDVGMETLCSARYLELLELKRCQKVSNKGLQFVVRFPRLSVLKLMYCSSLSDCGLKPLLGSGKLTLLLVEHCPEISEAGAQGAAETVTKYGSLM